jgi:8-oxo-dGTP pyrophosphatase MutT (NUDIX family)
MSYLRHITICNTHDLGRYRPFFVAGQRVGAVREDLFALVSRLDTHFEVRGRTLALSDRFASPQARAAAMDEVTERLREEGWVRKFRRERYPVLTQWGAEPLLDVDRAVVAHFGFKAFGLHVNGFQRGSDGLRMWVGKRSLDRAIAPGQLDNLIAGGQPAGLSLDENLVKEAKEEAGLSPEQARRAVPVGAITYLMENEHGLKPDTMFVYDLELAAGIVPRNTDGEVERFFLWPLAQAAESVRTTDDWKFNCNLVVIDFLVRHGFLTPAQPDYLALVRGLRSSNEPDWG